MIKSYKDLELYQKSYKSAMGIFHLTKKFPKEEIYSLASQIWFLIFYFFYLISLASNFLLL